MDGVMQIIIGRERRRRWSVQDKLRIMGELAERARGPATSQPDTECASA